MKPLSEVESPEDILVCDVCRRPIDDLGLAMWYWDPRTEQLQQGAAMLAHKRCASDKRDGGHDYSLELMWLCRGGPTTGTAMNELLRLMLMYEWSGPQARRLVAICWAAQATREKPVSEK